MDVRVVSGNISNMAPESHPVATIFHSYPFLNTFLTNWHAKQLLTPSSVPRSAMAIHTIFAPRLPKSLHCINSFISPRLPSLPDLTPCLSKALIKLNYLCCLGSSGLLRILGLLNRSFLCHDSGSRDLKKV